MRREPEATLDPATQIAIADAYGPDEYEGGNRSNEACTTVMEPATEPEGKWGECSRDQGREPLHG